MILPEWACTDDGLGSGDGYGGVCWGYGDGHGYGVGWGYGYGSCEGYGEGYGYGGVTDMPREWVR